MNDLKTSPRTRTALQTVELDGELVAYDPAYLKMHRFDALGSIVFQCLDGTVTIDELIDELAAEFGAERERVASDVAALVEVLDAEGLLLAEGEVEVELVDEPVASVADEAVLTDPPSP